VRSNQRPDLCVEARKYSKMNRRDRWSKSLRGLLELMPVQGGSEQSMPEASGEQTGSLCQVAGDRQCLLARRKGYGRHMDVVAVRVSQSTKPN